MNFMEFMDVRMLGMAGWDWLIIALYFIVTLAIGLSVSKKAGKDETSFFLGGRSQPWWLLGFSMVATTFSTDTPNLVADIVRTKGVSGNWVWWAFLLTGMLTVFIYAKLWRRSGILTDLEFYEIRYSGKWASFLRGFRAVYLGLIFNVIIMGTVTLAAIKIGGIILGLAPWQSILFASVVTLLISGISGFQGVLLTDFLLFILAMTGAVAAAVYAVKAPEVGGLTSLIDTFKNATPETNPALVGKLSIIPKGSDLVPIFIIPIAVQWWSVYYPGAEPGGGGYLVQKMLAAKDEKNSLGATLFFNVCHYALRPWPWIIVALASMLIFPDMASISNFITETHGPEVMESVSKYVKEDAAYSAMVMKFLPTGIMGMMMASLLAAYMSTIGTHLNWGSSYMVNDVWKRFIRPKASHKEGVWVGRASTLILLVISALMALYVLENAKAAFDIILSIGAGTGLLLILRWFWWRITPISEISAMIASLVITIINTIIKKYTDIVLFEEYDLLIVVAGTTIVWLTATFLSKPTEQNVLEEFVRKLNPGGPGWKKVFENAAKNGNIIEPEAEATNLPRGILMMVLGTTSVYGALFATGMIIYREWTLAAILGISCLIATAAILTLIIKSPNNKMKNN